VSERTTGILSVEQWLALPAEEDENLLVFGSRSQPTVRVQTKNLIEAGEKSFKTTFTLRWMIGLSCGVTVYPQFPVLRPRKVLYLHGEMSKQEIQDRTRDAIAGLSRPLDNFGQVKDLDVHLINDQGQKRLDYLLESYKPDDLVLDPWQGFITGCDENTFQDMSRATRFLDRMISKHGVTLHIVTHTGKDHSKGTRGHSTIAGWRDTLIRLDRQGKKSPLVRVSVDPRWAPAIEPFRLRFQNGILAPDDTTPEMRKQARTIESLVLRNAGPMDKATLIEKLGLSREAGRKALKRAEEDGVVTLDGDLVIVRLSDNGGQTDTL